jgi:hypothetical protein
MKVRQTLLKFVSPQTPVEERLRTARGEFNASPPLSPEDRVTVLFILSHDADAGVAAAAKKSFEECPSHTICDALDKKLDPAVIKAIVKSRGDNDAILIMAALNTSTDDDTLRIIAETGPEEVIDLLAEDTARLLSKPFILEAIRKNPLASPVQVASIASLIANPPKPVAAEPNAPQNEAVESLKGGDDEVEAAKKARPDETNIFKLVSEMSVGNKVKLALTGGKAARELLVKESNKLVAVAVLKNPRITEDEVLRLSSSKGVPEDILRLIGRNKEWIKNYSIKVNMVTNSKTPLAISIKLMDQLLEKDLTKLAKSKNVPSVVASTARRKLEVKKDH